MLPPEPRSTRAAAPAAPAAGEILEALSSSLDLHAVMKEAFPLLARRIPADRGALCVSAPDAPGAYAWVVAELPDAFFRGYPEIAAHDFVRRAVLPAPGRVLRDAEMIGRRDLERNLMYRRSRELGMPMEHVMAVLLPIGEEGAHGGLTLYRDRRKPFSERDRAVLQGLVRPLAHTMRNCRRFQGVTGAGEAIRALVDHRGIPTLILSGHGVEITRTPRATELIERWFPAAERRGGIPDLVRSALGRARVSPPLGPVRLWVKGAEGDLRLSIERLPDALGEPRWAVELVEVRHPLPIPASLHAPLSRREREVAVRHDAGWARALIAESLGCSEETVKTHLAKIRLKLGARPPPRRG